MASVPGRSRITRRISSSRTSRSSASADLILSSLQYFQGGFGPLFYGSPRSSLRGGRPGRRGNPQTSARYWAFEWIASSLSASRNDAGVFRDSTASLGGGPSRRGNPPTGAEFCRVSGGWCAPSPAGPRRGGCRDRPVPGTLDSAAKKRIIAAQPVADARRFSYFGQSLEIQQISNSI